MTAFRHDSRCLAPPTPTALLGDASREREKSHAIPSQHRRPRRPTTQTNNPTNLYQLQTLPSRPRTYNNIPPRSSYTTRCVPPESRLRSSNPTHPSIFTVPQLPSTNTRLPAHTTVTYLNAACDHRHIRSRRSFRSQERQEEKDGNSIWEGLGVVEVQRLSRRDHPLDFAVRRSLLSLLPPRQSQRTTAPVPLPTSRPKRKRNTVFCAPSTRHKDYPSPPSLRVTSRSKCSVNTAVTWDIATYGSTLTGCKFTMFCYPGLLPHTRIQVRQKPLLNTSCQSHHPPPIPTTDKPPNITTHTVVDRFDTISILSRSRLCYLFLILYSWLTHPNNISRYAVHHPTHLPLIHFASNVLVYMYTVTRHASIKPESQYFLRNTLYKPLAETSSTELTSAMVRHP